MMHYSGDRFFSDGIFREVSSNLNCLKKRGIQSPGRRINSAGTLLSRIPEMNQECPRGRYPLEITVGQPFRSFPLYRNIIHFYTKISMLYNKYISVSISNFHTRWSDGKISMKLAHWEG